jgi:hypothetical protein
MATRQGSRKASSFRELGFVGSMSNSVSDAIFSAETSAGPKLFCLFELMASAVRGELVDLTKLAAHQRAPLVTVLAMQMHVLARYAAVEQVSASSWANAWDKLIGDNALHISAPHQEVAFLQPPTGEPKSQQSLQAADLLLPNVEHEVKRTWSTERAEIAILALIGSLARPNVKDHRSSTRTGLCAVLPSVDGTLASEICCLLSAYDELKLPTKSSATAQDHFVWLKPYQPKTDEPVSFAELPRPFLDVGRAQRLVEREDGQWEVWACPNNTIRVTGTDPWLDDPQTPRVTDQDGTKRYKLAAKLFDHRFQHHVLFGGVGKGYSIERPRILDLVEYRYARLCALGSDQGKTKGYHEALFVAKRSEGLFHFDPPTPEDRPALLSEAALATISSGATILYSALAALYPDTNDLEGIDKKRISVVQQSYYGARCLVKRSDDEIKLKTTTYVGIRTIRLGTSIFLFPILRSASS